VTNAYVVAAPQPALRSDRASASHVVEERQVIDVRYICPTPAREASEIDREQCVSKRALRGHVVRQVSGKRNRREKLCQAKALLRPRLGDYGLPASSGADDLTIIEGRETQAP